MNGAHPVYRLAAALAAAWTGLVALRAVPALRAAELGVLAGLLLLAGMTGSAARRSKPLAFAHMAAAGAAAVLLAGAILRLDHATAWAIAAGAGLAVWWLAVRGSTLLVDWPGTADAAAVGTALLVAGLVAFDLTVAAQAGTPRTLADWWAAIALVALSLLAYGALSRALWPYRKPRRGDPLSELLGLEPESHT